MVFLCTSKPTKSVRSVMVRLVQCLGRGSSIGATPVALQNALLDTSRRATSTGYRLPRTSGLASDGLFPHVNAGLCANAVPPRPSILVFFHFSFVHFPPRI